MQKVIAGRPEPDCNACPLVDIAPMPGAQELVDAYIMGKNLRQMNPYVTDVEKPFWGPAGVLDDPVLFIGMEKGYATFLRHQESKRKAKKNSDNYLRSRKRGR